MYRQPVVIMWEAATVRKLVLITINNKQIIQCWLKTHGIIGILIKSSEIDFKKNISLSIETTMFGCAYDIITELQLQCMTECKLWCNWLEKLMIQNEAFFSLWRISRKEANNEEWAVWKYKHEKRVKALQNINWRTIIIILTISIEYWKHNVLSHKSHTASHCQVHTEDHKFRTEATKIST